MSYQSANFNRNQSAIKAMSDIAAGNVAATDGEAKSKFSSVRYAKDLVVADSAKVAEAATVPLAAVTEEIQQAHQPSVDTSEPTQNTASFNQTHAHQTHHQTYATHQDLSQDVSSEERGVALALWLGSLLFLMIPAMIVLLNSQSSDYLKEQAREAINWTSTFVIGSIVCTILVLIVIGGPLQVLLSVAHVVFCLLGANAARAGKVFRVPMTWRPLD